MFLKTKNLFFSFILFPFFLFPLTPSQSLNHGVGLITIPTARHAEEGLIGFSYSAFEPYNHYRFYSNPYDWLEVSFFYTDINTIRYNLGETGQSYKDKGFSAKFLLKKEDNLPSISLGLEDFAGTGIQSSEYLVFSKSFKNIDYSFGIGWGRLGSSSNISNPFAKISKNFEFRNNFSDQNKNIKDRGGALEINNWFKGSTSIFGGFEYKLNEKMSLKFEYDPIDYSTQYGYQCNKCNYVEKDPINYGFVWQPNNILNFGIYLFQEDKISFQLSIQNLFTKNKKIEFDLKNSQKIVAESKRKFYDTLLKDLANEGILLQNANFSEKNKRLELNYIQIVDNNELEVSKALEYRLKNNTNIEEIIFIPKNSRFNLAKYTLKNGEAELSKFDEKILDSFEYKPEINFPVPFLSSGLGYRTHIGSPSGFVIGEINYGINISVALTENIEFDTRYTFSIYDNYEKLNYDPVYTTAPRVRTDIQSYLKEGKKGFDTFSLSHFKQYGDNIYSFISIGDLEPMFGGLYFEILKRNFDGIFSYGFDLGYVKQRDFSKQILSFRDYETLVGNINFFAFEPKNDIEFKFSIGRYLAKDYGFTFDAGRRFKNGLKLGAYFTRTDMPAEVYGEGSFDKGIYVSFPLKIFSIGNAKGYSQQRWNPITRDGGAKLNISRNLYDLTRYSSSYDYKIK